MLKSLLKAEQSNQRLWILKVDLKAKGVRHRLLLGQFKNKSQAQKYQRQVKSVLTKARLKGLVRKWINW